MEKFTIVLKHDAHRHDDSQADMTFIGSDGNTLTYNSLPTEFKLQIAQILLHKFKQAVKAINV